VLEVGLHAGGLTVVGSVAVGSVAVGSEAVVSKAVGFFVERSAESFADVRELIR